MKFLGTEGFGNVQEVEVMPENVRFGLPPEIVEAIASAPAGLRSNTTNYGRHTSPLVPWISARAHRPPLPQMRFGKIDDLISRVAAAIDGARNCLFSEQHEEGYWCGELEADATLEADYIVLHVLLGTGNPERMAKAARYILQHQNEDGGWSIYASGPSNISASVKCYFGLKLAGYAADHPDLARARKKILEMGGVTEVNTFTKIYLCFFGQYDYDAVPAIPPEIVLFPKWFWFNIYEISSWSRAILVPLSICYAKKPFKKIPDELGVEELFVGGRDKSRMHLRWDKKLFSWRNFFLSLDRLTHWFERVHIRPLRSIALKQAEKWMLERFEMSDGLGAIFPSMMNSIIALRCLGYSVDDPQVIRAMDEFEKLGIEEEDTFRMQPCKSPVWDTAYALFALGESGVPASDPRMVKCADWILQKQVRIGGRLESEEQAGPAGRMVFRIQQRVLSRCGRQRHGLPGLEPRGASQRTLPARVGAARH